MSLRNLTLAAILLAVGGFSYAIPVRPLRKSDADEHKPIVFHWRTDYQEARKEAERTKRMIVLFFPNPHSDVGAKMELAVKDPKLTAFMHENTVALRLEAGSKDRNELTQKLAINYGYRAPVIIIAHHDGRIADTLVGYQEAEALLDYLSRAKRENDSAK